MSITDEIKSYKERACDRVLEAGVKAQIEKFKENEHKPDLENISITWAASRIADEKEELDHELTYDNYDPVLGIYLKKKLKYVDYAKVRKEAADIANFAHMIIYECDKRLLMESVVELDTARTLKVKVGEKSKLEPVDREK